MTQSLKNIFLKFKLISDNRKIKKRYKYVLEMRFGAPGSGKTTDLARQAYKATKLGLMVFSNVHLNIPGVYKLEMDDLGKYFFPQSLILIDEASLSGLDNRSWKSFSKELLTFFKLHRHFMTKIIIYSQASNDCDKKVRDLQMYCYNIKRSILPGFSVMDKYVKYIAPNETEDELVLKIKKSLLGTRWFWRGKYYKYFDSYEIDRSMFPDKVFETYVSDDYINPKSLKGRINRLSSIINNLKNKNQK